MKDRQDVLEKFRELRDRYLAERKDQYLGRRPINCSHNIRLRVKGKGHLGFCQNSLILAKCGSHKMFICNDDDTAARCRVFSCRSTNETVERDFNDVLASPSRCGNDYPKLAMLIWFLQDVELHSRFSRFGQLVKMSVSAIWKIITFRWW
jgi:hypothetical protein